MPAIKRFRRREAGRRSWAYLGLRRGEAMTKRTSPVMGRLTAVLLAGTCLSPCPVWAVDFIVSNNSDSGAGSLRQAIIDLNTSGGASNNIIVNSGVGTITLTSGDLQTVARNATIVGNNNTLSRQQPVPRPVHRRLLGHDPDGGRGLDRGPHHHQCPGGRRQRRHAWRGRGRGPRRRPLRRRSGQPHREQCQPHRQCRDRWHRRCDQRS